MLSDGVLLAALLGGSGACPDTRVLIVGQGVGVAAELTSAFVRLSFDFEENLFA